MHSPRRKEDIVVLPRGAEEAASPALWLAPHNLAQERRLEQQRHRDGEEVKVRVELAAEAAWREEERGGGQCRRAGPLPPPCASGLLFGGERHTPRELRWP